MRKKNQNFLDNGHPQVFSITNFLPPNAYKIFSEGVESLPYESNSLNKEMFTLVHFGSINTPVARSEVAGELERKYLKLSSGRYAFRFDKDSGKITSTKFSNYYGTCRISYPIELVLRSLHSQLASFFPKDPSTLEYNPISFGFEIQKHVFHDEVHSNGDSSEKTGLRWHTDVAHSHNDTRDKVANLDHSQVSFVYYSKVDNIQGGDLVIKKRGDEAGESELRLTPRTNTALLFNNTEFKHMVTPISRANPAEPASREVMVVSFNHIPKDLLPELNRTPISLHTLDNSTSASYQNLASGLPNQASESHRARLSSNIINGIYLILQLLIQADYDSEQFNNLSSDKVPAPSNDDLKEPKCSSNQLLQLAYTIWLHMVAAHDSTLLNNYDRTAIARAICHQKVGFWNREDLTPKENEMVQPVEQRFLELTK